MENQCRKGESPFLSGLFWGVLAGIVVGLLYAPDKGDKTRRKVIKEYDKWRGEADKQISNLRQMGEEHLPEVKERIKTHRNQVKTKAKEFADRAKTEVVDAREAMEKHLAEKQKVL